jgi:hypothetical protein
MRLRYTERFLRSYEAAPSQVRRTFDKQVALLSANLRHPSLRAKKYDRGNDLWQARVNRDWRFYFTSDGETYTLLDLIPHPK